MGFKVCLIFKELIIVSHTVCRPLTHMTFEILNV